MPTPFVRRDLAARRVVASLAVVAASLATSHASAQTAGFAPWPSAPEGPPRDDPASGPRPARETSDVEVDVAAVTAVPLFVGGQVTIELPVRLQLQGELGVLPGAYVDAADSILVGAGAYGNTESEILRDVLNDAFVMRLSGGWRPFAEHGLELFGGYTLISLGASMATRDAVESFANVTLPQGVGTQQIELDATLHAVHASIGWRWVIADHLTIRTSIGYVHTLAASSSVTVPDGVSDLVGSSNVDAASSIAESRLDDLLTTYGKLPTVGLSVGYRF